MKHLLLLITVLPLVSCSDPGKLRPLSGNAVVLAFGDSLTYGTGTTRNRSYPSQLESMIGRKVVNAGVPGEVTKDGLARLPGLLQEHDPELVILIHGGNDMLRRRNLTQAANNIKAMIAIAEEQGIQVVMLAVPNPSLILSPAQFYETVANDTGVVTDMDIISDVLQYPSNKSDRVHPNATGYRIMAEGIRELLQDEGAI